jgi:hypothetical protein
MASTILTNGPKRFQHGHALRLSLTYETAESAFELRRVTYKLRVCFKIFCFLISLWQELENKALEEDYTIHK